MDKPVTLKKVELEQKLVQEIESCQMPAFIVAYILESILGQLKAIEKQQYDQDLKRWNEEQEDVYSDRTAE